MRRLTTSWAFLLASGLVSIAYAQEVTTNITPTGGIGDLGTTVTQAGPSFDITGGTRPNSGPNLFHSFGRFSVGTGDTANFLNDSGLATENILSRVTGGNPSNIFGTLQTTGFPGADLYLLNPSGVLFGPTASLNVEGGFHVSTADFIELGDGVRFDALPSPNDALLSVAPPAAFGFLDDDPAPLEIFGSDTQDLSVPAGETLSIAAGDIEMANARITAASGRINIASVASPQKVVLAQRDLRVVPLGSPGQTQLGNVGITQDSEIDLGADGDGVFIRSGRFTLKDSGIFTGTLGGGAAGDVSIQVTDSVLIDQGGISAVSSSSSGDPGDILIEAKNVELKGGPPDFPVAVGAVALFGTAGSISIQADYLRLGGYAQILSISFAGTQGGNISLSATESVTLSGPDSAISILDEGEGGSISVVTKALDLAEGSDITAQALGFNRGANITIHADRVQATGFARQADAITGQVPDLTQISTETRVFDAPAGNLSISAKQLEVSNGAQLLASTFGPGQAGNVDVNADSIRLHGGIDSFRSGLLVSAERGGTGNAGTLNVLADNLEITGGAQISAATSGSGRGGNLKVQAGRLTANGGEGDFRSGLLATAAIGSTGPGGNLTVTADELALTNGAEINAATFGPGRGGNVTVTARDILLRDGGSIAANSESAGKSGSVFIRATDTFRLFNDSQISVETTQANASDIDLDVGFLLHLRDRSSITTSVAGGQGDGGNITIDPVFTVLDGGSSIIARAREGRGGNISIVSDFLFVSPDSVISASSELGVSGVVDIESPETDVVSGALALPESFLDAASLLSERCTARAIKGSSSFIVSGRGGVPPGPETVLPSFPELGLHEAPKAKGSASVSENALAEGTLPVECAIE